MAASTPMGVFNQRSEALFPHTGLCSLLWFPAVPSSLSVCECGAAASAHLTGSTSHCLAASPLRPGCPSPPLLPLLMNVSLSPWFSDFHTVQFSVSSGCFLFLNCCCPSFGCARRHSVSTSASILARSLSSV